MSAGGTAAIVLLLVAAAGVGGAVAWSVRKYGWPGTWRLAQSLPRLACERLARAARWVRGGRRGGARRRGGAAGGAIDVDAIRFARFVEPTHKVALQYPASWVVVKSDSQASSIIAQITCDTSDEAYKRLSLSWDDVSWSATSPAQFARGIVDNLGTLVPGAELVSQGPYRADARTDGAYEVVYSVADAADGAALLAQNVFIVSTAGGRRRVYTLTFAADAAAFDAARALARTILESFTVGDAAVAGGAARSPSGSTADRDDVHVNVWERSALLPAAAAPGAGAAAAAAAAVAVSHVADTAAAPDAVTWATGTIAQAGVAYASPASWLCSGLGHDESLGFAPVAVHSVRRWCISHTCDRREAAYKHMSVVCVDVTPCFDLISSRLAKNPRALEGSDPGTLLATYLVYRYKSELAEAAAVAAARAPAPPPLAAGEEVLRPWLDTFGQRWPPTCLVSTPVSHGTSADVVVPTQATVLESRTVGTSRLLKVRGTVRTVPAAAGGSHRGSSAGAAEASAVLRRSSTYSSLSLDHDSVAAEGLTIDVTSAVLFGIHDAAVVAASVGKGAAARGAAPLPTVKRVFGHVVTFATAADVFATYEPLAKRVFRSLDIVSPAAAPAAGGAGTPA